MGVHSGNLQKIKDGKRRFAITPHIPGGFVTADTMIKIADTAKKYNGIIKITSGQRIMITNLKEEDLSEIWKDLGMEPAVKNQYSIKNVEMCPAGFCKRSKENTIRIGMKISRNFHGKEMPNRTKIAVAGCRNACASAYAKDIALIATKEGFIIAAGGSAGFHQRMADIIAEKISEEDAYRLVEIILEYYNENALLGEKLGFFIDRIGVEKFRNDVVEKL
ncbi:MAG: NAD(P)/FAD-dependent oxidoreductase [Tepidibacter sp.]|uniref:NAD(P)/FAD-dependent oxidoreductase n=1 Tax=Tepidibacter sp. TaxID=2529387 RepID=UPI0025D72728|nr:NAD(P)/FAD-dependent oxidoreductase [Tepidibacter sp.]MCT4509869.1 NAD(P)/FAD-dependent oxidoreductase [Tepidibacter sp.]